MKVSKEIIEKEIESLKNPDCNWERKRSKYKSREEYVQAQRQKTKEWYRQHKNDPKEIERRKLNYQKRKEEMTNNPPRFYCKLCDYKCNFKSSIINHVNTIKHRSKKDPPQSLTVDSER